MKRKEKDMFKLPTMKSRRVDERGCEWIMKALPSSMD
jgi:hypothetical protein